MRTTLVNTQVTALKAAGRYILAGEGRFVHVFGPEGDSPLASLELLHGCTVHGFDTRVADNGAVEAVAFGGKSVQMFRVAGGDAGSFAADACSRRMQVTDWIWDLRLERGRTVLVVDAHNMVERWKLEPWERVLRVGCGDTSILYSAQLVASSSDTIVIAGTAFGEVTIWSPFPEAVVIHRLGGHRGAIFSVYYCSQLGLICTTSDDRALRLWEVQPMCLNRSDWVRSQVVLRATCYAHRSRVWRALTVNGTVVSTGEDGSVCYWDPSGILTKRVQSHEARSVTHCGTSLITGGDDSRIIAWSTDIGELPASLNFPAPDFPRTVKIVDESNYVAVGDSGVIYTYNIHTHSWKESYRDEGFKHYAVVDYSDKKLAVGSLAGIVVILDVGCTSDGSVDLSLAHSQDISPDKIESVVWLSGEVLLASSGQTISLCKVGVGGMEEGRKLALPSKRSQSVTAAKIVLEHVLICGDRNGGISVYCLNHEAKEPVIRFPRIHGFNGVTRIEVSVVHSDTSVVVTAGRDGRLRTFVLNFTNGQAAMRLTSTDIVPMDWLTRVTLDGNRQPETVLGFLRTNFVVWSHSQQMELASVECGGGHRSWAWFTHQSGGASTLLFVRHKQVYQWRCRLEDTCRELRPRLHSATLNSLLRFPIENGSILVTGSDDTSVGIHRLASHSRVPIRFVRSHLSSVRVVALARLEPPLILTGGGRAELKAWSISESECEELASLTLGENVSTDTRVMDVHAIDVEHICVGCSDGHIRILSYKPNQLNVESEIMCLNSCILKVRVVCCDGKFVILSFDTKGVMSVWDATVVPVCQLHQSGINAVDMIELCVMGGQCHLVATGGDDGAVRLTLVDLRTEGDQVAAHVKCWWEEAGAHSAQVSGVKLLPGNIMLSASGDQRLVKWKWSLDDGLLSARFESELCTSIPDIQGMEVWEETSGVFSACVYGQGLEVVEIELSQ